MTSILPRHRASAPKGESPTGAVLASRSDHLANERTHLAYVRTAISLVSLGITVNRFSLYLQQHETLSREPGHVEVLGGAARAGLGMVIYGLMLMLLALHRFYAVENAIDTGRIRPGRPLVTFVTVSVVIAAAAAILWMFQ